MATREQILSAPRSGASEGAGRAQRRAPDQGSRDELAAARARSRKRSGALPSARDGGDASRAPRGDGSPGSAGPSAAPSPARRKRSPATYDEILAGERTKAEQADYRRRAREQVASERLEDQPELAGSSTPAPRSFAHEGAGALLALVVYPLAINFLRGGTAQMWGWVKAKALNQPYAGRAPASYGSQARQHQGAGATLQKAGK